jgi:arginase family enzyme
MTETKWSAIPYYFGRYNAVFERYLRDDFSAEIIKSSGGTLGSILVVAYNSAPRLLIGGDCFTALPVIFSHRNKIENVYWFDAHGDFHDETSTSSGFLGGMPFAALTGYSCERLLKLLGESPISPTKCKHVGGRSWDVGEKERIQAAGVVLLDTPPLELNAPSHIHIDVDCFNTKEVPNVTHLESGGLSISVVDAFLQRNAGWITSMTVSAWKVETKPPEGCIQLLQNFVKLQEKL